MNHVRFRIASVVLLVTGLGLCVPAAFGQAVAGGSVAGLVTDPTAAAVANATVTMTETEKQVTHTTVTDASGHYVFTDLPVGPYRLEVKSAGFKDYVQNGIELQVGSSC